MKSWTPRKPSPAIGDRLFGNPSGNIDSYSHSSKAQWLIAQWFAPAVAASLVLLAAVGPGRFERHLAVSEGGPLLAAALSNLTQAAYLTSAFHSEHNTVGQETLEWTVRPPSTSNVPSFRLFGTNALLQ